MRRYGPAFIRHCPKCTACHEPLHPAATAGGHQTHPGCDLGPQRPPQGAHEAIVIQFPTRTTEEGATA